MSIREELAVALVTVRRLRRVSQEELAAKSGVSIQTISSIENAKISPTIDTLSTLAESLDVPLADLFASPKQRQSKKSLRQYGHIIDQLQSLDDVGMDIITANMKAVAKHHSRNGG